MHKTLTCAALAATLAVPALAYDGIQTFTGGAHFYKRVVTHTNVLLGSNEKFEVLPGASTTVFVPPKTVVLVNVGFSAETRCTGADVAQNWCEMSITVGGNEASPMASTYGGDTFAVDATDTGNATEGNWRAHAFTRHTCVRNEGDTPLALPVAVNWKVTNFAGNPPLFWVDDSALVVEMARGCSVSNTPSPNPDATSARVDSAPRSAQQ
jgi:hypothetical protein